MIVHARDCIFKINVLESKKFLQLYLRNGWHGNQRTIYIKDYLHPKFEAI